MSDCIVCNVIQKKIDRHLSRCEFEPARVQQGIMDEHLRLQHYQAPAPAGEVAVTWADGKTWELTP